jgi:hypothetical protein
MLVLGDMSGTGNTHLFRFLTAIGHLFVESEVAARVRLVYEIIWTSNPLLACGIPTTKLLKTLLEG